MHSRIRGPQCLVIRMCTHLDDHTARVALSASRGRDQAPEGQGGGAATPSLPCHLGADWVSGYRWARREFHSQATRHGAAFSPHFAAFFWAPSSRTLSPPGVPLRPCGHAARVPAVLRVRHRASDSVHRQSAGQVSSATETGTHRAELCSFWAAPLVQTTDCKSLLNCLAKDASVPEDRGTALTVAPLREKCSAGVGRDSKRLGFTLVPGASAVDGRTDEIIGWSLLEKCSHIWNRSASRREYESSEAETTHRQSERSPRRLSCPNGS